MLYRYISFEDLVDAFRARDKLDAWTREGLRALYDHMDANEDDHLLDVVELDSTWREYESFAAAYRDQINPDAEIDDDDAQDYYDRQDIAYIQVPLSSSIVVER